jgi:multicomponent Na+:H+ antiporter subunit E
VVDAERGDHVVAMSVGLGGSGRGGVRIAPLTQFLWLVAVDLVVSTATVVREVLTPTDRTEEGIIAVSIPAGCRHHLLMFYVAITVTPGTAVVAAKSDGSVLYLHVLHCDRRAGHDVPLRLRRATVHRRGLGSIHLLRRFRRAVD